MANFLLWSIEFYRPVNYPDYSDSYCVPTTDYVEQVTSTITVEDPS